MKCKLVNPNYQCDYVKSLMASRGIEDLEAYVGAGRESIQEPAALENLERGLSLYCEVMARPDPKILIIVDSDNDGFTSATMMGQYTARLQSNAKIFYWLHSGKQHGLEDHIAKLREMEPECFDLIILPDSSSNDFEYHEELKEKHIPCLVLDHHITDLEISDNAVIINNQLSPKYKNKELTGAGIVYQFCRALDARLGNEWADDYLDLAAWGVIGDMGSVLEPENRAIINLGLGNIKNRLLWALMEKQAYSITGSSTPSERELVEAMNPISVAFYIVPLVNAMIRVGTMEEKNRLFNAFLDGDAMIPSGKRGAKGTLDKAGNEAARECTNARARQNKMLDKAIDMVESKIHKFGLLENRILFVRLEEEEFPSELNGLLAMKLSQQFKRPTIVARLNSQGYDRGSMRGLSQSALTSFKEFLESSELFEYVAGHDNAAGVSIANTNLQAFHAFANEQLAGIDFGENVFDVNFERTAVSTDLPSLIADIARYDGIWGQHNDTPLIHVKDINITSSDFKIIGKNSDTLRFEKNGITYIKFHASDLIEKLKGMSGQMKVEVVGKANLNEWMGRVTPQIMIEDMEFKKSSIYDF